MSRRACRCPKRSHRPSLRDAPPKHIDHCRLRSRSCHESSFSSLSSACLRASPCWICAEILALRCCGQVVAGVLMRGTRQMLAAFQSVESTRPVRIRDTSTSPVGPSAGPYKPSDSKCKPSGCQAGVADYHARKDQEDNGMITKFDSLYVGHVDLDNIGYAGTPINDRLYSNEHLATALEKAQSMAVLMDRHGYNAFWMAEHHFQREGTECIPNVLMMALHLTHVTKNLKIGCGFNIAPMWHPLRLAEDYAMADILSNGRVIFGLGVAIIRVKWRRSVRRCSIRPPIASSTKSRPTSSSRRSTASRSATRATLHATAGGALSRLHAKGTDAGAAPAAASGGELAADPGWFGRALEFMARMASRAWSAAARPRAARCTRSRSAGRKRTRKMGKHIDSASGCASASTSTWPTARRTASSARARTTKRT